MPANVGGAGIGSFNNVNTAPKIKPASNANKIVFIVYIIVYIVYNVNMGLTSSFD